MIGLARSLAVMLPLALVAVGCSSMGSPAPRATVTVTATPHPSSTPAATPLTRKQAARAYLALVKPYNRATDRCNKATRAWSKGTWNTDPQTMIARLHKACNPMVAAERAFDVGLETTPWPAEARDDVRALLDYSRAVLYAYEQTRDANTVDDVNAVAWPKDDGAADLVRARFGLAKRSVRP